MSEQFNLPGFDLPPTPPRHSLAPAALDSARPTHRLFLAVFPKAHDAAPIAASIAALRQHHGLNGQPLQTDRLHTTLHSLGDYVGPVPQVRIDAAMAAASSLVHPPLQIEFDHALSFAGSGHAAKHAFVLCGHDTAAVSRLVQILGLALKRVGLDPQPSRKPHMTMLYDRRIIEAHVIEPIRWTASELVLVLSHLGKTHHQWLARWPLTGAP